MLLSKFLYDYFLFFLFFFIILFYKSEEEASSAGEQLASNRIYDGEYFPMPLKWGFFCFAIFIV